MCSVKIITVILLANCVFANPIFEKDCKNDCWAEGMTTFFKEFAAGKSDIEMVPMDPMVVKNINFPEEALEINSFFPELKVSGLKNVVVSDFHKDANVAHLYLKYDMIAEGPVNVQFPKKNKELKGTIKYEAAIAGQISYPVNYVNGKAVIGQETLSCEASNAKYTMDKDFSQVLENDSDASAVKGQYDKIHDNHVKKVACEISKAAFKVVAENLRALAKSDL